MVFRMQASVAVLESPAMGEEEVGIVRVERSIRGNGDVIGREQLLQTRAYDHSAMLKTAWAVGINVIFSSIWPAT